MADYVQGTTNIWPYYSASNKSTTKADSSLGKDDFLRILIAQISNQDPTKPLEDKEFISQMAQFTSVEQLTNMSKELKELKNSLGFSATMIGKSVEWQSASTDESEGVILNGIVNSIAMRNGEPYVVIDGEEISMGRIITVKNEVQPKSDEIVDNEIGEQEQ